MIDVGQFDDFGGKVMFSKVVPDCLCSAEQIVGYRQDMTKRDRMVHIQAQTSDYWMGGQIAPVNGNGDAHPHQFGRAH